jgi:hypothetical protein
MNERFDSLIENGFEIQPFAALAMSHKLAMAHYMSIDGEAWNTPELEEAYVSMVPRLSPIASNWRTVKMRQVQALEAAMPSLVTAYGDIEFGVFEASPHAIAQFIVRDEAVKETFRGSAEAWLAMYRRPARGKDALPDHPRQDPWPVIMSSHAEETLQDGWKRFGSYSKSGFDTIPAIFYPQPRHYEMLDAMKGLRRAI